MMLSGKEEGEENKIDLLVYSCQCWSMDLFYIIFREYDLARATRACYSFWLYDLCDIYLECCKAVSAGDDEQAKDAAK